MVYAQKSYIQEINMFLSQVFGWMSFALLLTASSAYYCASSEAFLHLIASSKWVVFFIFIVQIVLVIAIAGFLNKLNTTTALMLFLLYSLLTGVIFSSIFLVYTLGSIGSTFLATAAMFAVMGLYGYLTGNDLSGMGSILLMMLVGIIITGIINLFLHNQTFGYLISGVSVVIFALLTAYDVQKLKMYAQYAKTEPESKQKFIILGALTLYLDFVNLFINLLRFMGRKKD